MRSVSQEVFVRASPDRVFAAFTDVPEVLAWLADAAVIGGRVGGNWALGWYVDEDSEDGDHVLGTFEVYAPPSRLVVKDLRYSPSEGELLEGMRLSVELVPEDGGTRVRVRHEGLGDGASWDAYVAGLGSGWESSLSDLRDWLEEGLKLPGR
jgi:uncharacterized protein YndB with AHSA1/START domain